MRKQQEELCMICGALPCECNPKKAKKAGTPRATKSKDKAPDPKPAMLERMRQASASSRPVAQPTVAPTRPADDALGYAHPSNPRPAESKGPPEVDAETAQAIRNLETLLSDETKRQYSSILAPLSPDERAAQWKSRRKT